MVLSLIDKVTTGTQSFALFIWNVGPVVAAVPCWTGGLPTALNVLNISEIIHLSDHDKSSSISQLLNGKSRDLQKRPKYFNGITTSTSNILLLHGVPTISFVLYQ